VCFVDYTQRRSQGAMLYLNKIRSNLRRSNVEVVCIQVAPFEEEGFVAWKKEHKITIPIGVLPGASREKSVNNVSILKKSSDSMHGFKQKWGVRSLPWTILADEGHKIMATGFEISRILTLVHEEKRPSSLRNNPSRRR
jgi:hypothetical protein